MLKMTKVELKLITDPEMYQFRENGKRGGVSMAGLRHARANNPYLVPANEVVKHKKRTNRYFSIQAEKERKHKELALPR